MVMLYSLKTHGKESNPQQIKITSIRDNMKLTRRQLHFCPFKLTQHFMSLRGRFQEDSEQFFIFRDRSPVQPHHIRKVLRELLSNMNLNGSLYDCHSLCIGRSLDLAKHGVPIETIRRMGRWKSNAVYRYLKD